MYTWYPKLFRFTYWIYNRLKTNTETNSFLKLSDNTMWGFVLICFLIQSLKAYCLYHHIIAAFIYSLRGTIKKNQCLPAHSDHCFLQILGELLWKLTGGRRKQYSTSFATLPWITSHTIYSNSAIILML